MLWPPRSKRNRVLSRIIEKWSAAGLERLGRDRHCGDEKIMLQADGGSQRPHACDLTPTGHIALQHHEDVEVRLSMEGFSTRIRAVQVHSRQALAVQAGETMLQLFQGLAGWRRKYQRIHDDAPESSLA